VIEKRRGHYLGTEIDGKWWRRYRKDGFFVRGLGEYWIENSFLYFHRYLTLNPIVISLCDVCEVKIGKWHSGSWAGGKPVVKILWEKDNRKLCSGFVLSADKKETESILSGQVRQRVFPIYSDKNENGG
jgi:hypothetical protein